MALIKCRLWCRILLLLPVERDGYVQNPSIQPSMSDLGNIGRVGVVNLLDIDRVGSPGETVVRGSQTTGGESFTECGIGLVESDGQVLDV